MDPYINTVDEIVTVNKRHYDDLCKRLKDATEIINAYHAGMEAQKKQIAKLKDDLRRETNSFGYDEQD